ncbi:MAG: hypothetical protein IPH06_06230 [Alphaproteobacteria bacterium]|jgi:hypothetical protein|nr:hypothetical protein [Alphaproteobacteria bacterium]QQS57616.1 MAG: hypothetical protein IPN28_01995 [Alphaproteobacteria bacterium]
MTPRSDLLLSLLENLGLPLIQAVDSSSWKSAPDPAKEAERLKDLLAASKSLGQELRKALHLPADGDKKSIRIALTVLAAQMIAAHQKNSGKAFSEQDVQRVTKGFEAVLAFSDDLIPEEESLEPLRKLGEDFALFGGYQIHVHLLHAFLPIIRAVSIFSFGQAGSKMVKDICDKLILRATELRGKLFGGGLDLNQARIAELSLLRILASLYADCHISETERFIKLHESARLAIQPSTIWDLFEQRMLMLEALATSFIPLAQGGDPQASDSAPPETPAVHLSAVNENTESDEGGDTGSGGQPSGTPMAFFKK